MTGRQRSMVVRSVPSEPAGCSTKSTPDRKTHMAMVHAWARNHQSMGCPLTSRAPGIGKKETTFFLGHIMGITGINQDEIRNLGEDVSSPEHP